MIVISEDELELPRSPLFSHKLYEDEHRHAPASSYRDSLKHQAILRMPLICSDAAYVKYSSVGASKVEGGVAAFRYRRAWSRSTQPAGIATAFIYWSRMIMACSARV